MCWYLTGLCKILFPQRQNPMTRFLEPSPCPVWDGSFFGVLGLSIIVRLKSPSHLSNLLSLRDILGA